MEKGVRTDVFPGKGNGRDLNQQDWTQIGRIKKNLIVLPDGLSYGGFFVIVRMKIKRVP